MTTSTTTPRLSYTADGSTAAFTFNFEIADSSSIAVYVGSTLKTLTTDYTVAFDTGTAGTGTVTFTSAPSSGTITLIRDTNLARTVDFQEGGAFLASTVNTEFDRLSQAVIDATDKIEQRAILLAEPNTETATLTVGDASARANKVLAFDGSGDVTLSDAAGTVTSITAGTGLSGGTITSSGTIAIDSTVATLTGSQTLTNKTLTSPIINTGVLGSDLNANSNNITNVANPVGGTDAVNKNYVDTNISAVSTSSISTGNTSATVTDTGSDGQFTVVADGNTELTITDTASTFSGTVETTSTSAGAIKTPTIQLDGSDNSITAIGTNKSIGLNPTGTGDVYATSDIIANGDLIATSQVKNSAITIGGVGNNQDAFIQGLRSNEDITIDPAGTGTIVLNAATTAGGNIAMGGNQITGLDVTGFPSADSDVAHKKYVDDATAAAFQTSVPTLQTGTTMVTTGSPGPSTTIQMKVSGNEEMTITDDGVRVHGNLTVDGTQTILNTATLSVEDNIITVNRNVSAVSGMPATSGLEVNRGADGTNATLLWNEADDRWDVVGGPWSAQIRTDSITDQGSGIDFNDKNLTNIGSVVSDSYSAKSGQDFYIGLQNNLAEAFRIVNSSGQNIITIDAGSGTDGDTINFEGNINTTYTASRPFTFSNTLTATGTASFTGTVAIDNLNIFDNKITSDSNADIILDPGGTGVVTTPSKVTLTGQTNLTPNLEITSYSGTLKLGDDPNLSNHGNSIYAQGSTLRLGASTGTVGIQNADLAIETGQKISFEAGSGEIHGNDFKIQGNKIETLSTNADIVLEPAGSGVVSTNALRILGSSTGTALNIRQNGVSDQVVLGDANNKATIVSDISTVDIFKTSQIDIRQNDITTYNSNADLNLSANGSGTVTINGLSFPTADGTNGQVLTTDGAGTLSFTAKSSLAVDPITFVGDDSTGTAVNTGETFKIAGTQNITTAVSGDTLTVTGPDLSSYITASSSDTLTNKSGNISQWTNDSGYLTSFTETNDLSSAVTWANVPDANITQSSVTQHQAALSVTESQVSDLGSYITASSTDTLTNKSGAISQWTNDAGYTTNTGTVTASTTDTFTNKTIDANGTGNSITNIDIDNMTAAVIVTAAETIASNNNDTTIPTSAAVKAYADSVGGGGGGTITALNNQAENRLVSIGSTTTELDGEANLTFDGSTLTLTGSAALDGVTIADNLITTNRSNDSLFIGSNGTGRIELSSDGGHLSASPTYPKYHFSPSNVKGVVLSRETSTDTDALTSREYGHVLHYGTTVTNGSSTNNHWNPRAVIFSSHTDMDGESYTKVSTSRGPVGLFTAATANNGSGSSASTLYNLRGSVTSAGIADYEGAPGQNMTIDRCVATDSAVMIETTGTSTNIITDAYNYFSGGYVDSAAGNTNSITNLYGFYHNASHGTNNYAFYDATNSLSVFGDVQTQAISITDNHISTNRSNDNLYIQANGTGRVNLGDVKLEDSAYWAEVFGNPTRVKGNALTYEDLAVNPNDLTDRELGHAIYMGTKITASSTNSNFRPRAALIGSMVDLAGFSYTNTNNFRGPLGAQIYGAVLNGTSTDVTINTVRGVETSASVADFTNTSGAITIVDSIGNLCANYHERNGTGDINITNDYGFKVAPDAYNASGGTGVTTITNSYAFHVQANSGNATVTNAYAFYSSDATASSRMGAIRLDNQSGDPTHGADFSWIYAKDDASSSEVYVKDEAGNVTKISPHNTAGDWEYYSVNSKTGKKVRINMERMIRKLEELTGETFIESE